jgi:hypothetical protein
VKSFLLSFDILIPFFVHSYRYIYPVRSRFIW